MKAFQYYFNLELLQVGLLIVNEMYLSGSNLHQFIERFSEPQNLLRNFCNEEKDKTCKEIEKAVKTLKITRRVG